MLEFLAKKFIKDNEQIDRPEVQSKYISLSGVLGLVLNIFLFVIKLSVGLVTNSIAIISDSFNNLSDSLTSVVAIIGSAASRKPADEDHPQGHGRLEYIASLIVGMIIVLMGIQLFTESINEIRNPSDTNTSWIFFLVLIVSNLVKIYMFKYNHYLSKKFNSKLNEGVAKDSLNDTIATTGIMISGLVSYFTGVKLDGIAGLVIAVLVFKTGLEFAISTISILMGEKASLELREEIIKEITKGEYIKGYHDLYIHSYGRGRTMAHAHVEVPKDISVFEMHEVIDKIEKKVLGKTGVELVLHMDPRYFLAELDQTETKIVGVNSIDNYDEVMEEAAEIIKEGNLVVVPTETVYGLAGDGLNPQAVEKIFQAKERSKGNPLILHIADKEDMDKYAVEIPEIARKLADELWPGPLTLVLKKSDLVPEIVSAGSNSVAIRMPDNETIRDLIRKSGTALACPSANISGRPSPTNVVDAYEDMKGKVPLILNDGSAKLGLESTIVDLTGQPSILRLGYIEVEKIKEIIPGVRVEEGQNDIYSKAQKAPHYKTNAEIFVYSFDLEDQVGRIQSDSDRLMDEGKKVGILISDEDQLMVHSDHVFNFGSKGDVEESGRVMFSKLRDFDRLGVDVILIQGLKEVGKAKTIMSRLNKASSGNIIKDN